MIKNPTNILVTKNLALSYMETTTTVIILIIIVALLIGTRAWTESTQNWRKWLLFPSWTEMDPTPLETSPLYRPHTQYPSSYYSPVKRVNDYLLTPDFRADPDQPHYYPHASPCASGFPLYPKLK